MFLSTLCIGEWSVNNWMKQKELSNEEIKELDENKNTHIKKASVEKIFLQDFLTRLPKLESHYCRKDSKKLYLEPQWHTISDLYRFYTNECKENNNRPLSHTYFKEEFDKQNLSLFKPKKDQCDTCNEYQVGNISQEDHQLHIDRKTSAQEEKSKQKELAQNNSSKLIFTMDVQAVLTAPKLQISASYYKKKLIAHNFTFFNLATKKGDCYIWHEGSGNITANEFTTIILHQIEKYLTTETKEVILFSDGCGYQNRNAILSNSLSYFAQMKNINIYQYYLEKGHTQMECDSMHACIERKIQNRDIYVPGCYVQICRNAKLKDPYDVEYLDYTFFKNYGNINQVYTSIRPGHLPGDAKVSDIRCLAYRINGDIQFKIKYYDEWANLPGRKKNICNSNQIPGQLYSAPLKINLDKFNHLQELKKYLPNDFRLFYDTLSHT